MDNWNEWSWLAIPATAWAFAWLLRGAAGGGEPRAPRVGSTWTITKTEHKPQEPDHE